MMIRADRLPSSPLPSSSTSTSSSTPVSGERAGVFRRTISRSSTRSTRRRKASLEDVGSLKIPLRCEEHSPSRPVSRDGQRFVDSSRAPSLARPPTATAVKSSRSRMLPTRVRETPTIQVTGVPQIPKLIQKRSVNSKDVLVYLYKSWLPQLTSSYRKTVPYQASDPETLQAFMDAMWMHRNRSFYLDKFKMVGRVVQAINILAHHTDINVAGNDGSSRSAETTSPPSSSSSSSSPSSPSSSSVSPPLRNVDSNLSPRCHPSSPHEKHPKDVFNQLSKSSDQHPGYSQSFRSCEAKLPYHPHRRSLGHIQFDIAPRMKHQLLLKSRSDGNFNTV